MHPYLEYLYIKALGEERERQADQTRLVALAHLRAQQSPAKRPRAPIKIRLGHRMQQPDDRVNRQLKVE
jgi:hypothetical protein